ncbi:Fur family transcriptional regulator [Enemella sp. A6]|uniref:Fur family transcriptional regulator n=1 Tax=Enemella sp. A6 TaxID=3440152 RepID=UPI003EB6E487
MLDAPTLLREARLRVTAPRVAVLTELADHPHADVERIRTLVRSRLGAVSTQAIYDVLKALTDAGLLRRVEPAGQPARYELDPHDNHHHAVCRRCGAVSDIACRSDDVPCMYPEDDRGYLIDQAEVIYWGVCPACRDPVPESATTHTPPQPNTHIRRI